MIEEINISTNKDLLNEFYNYLHQENKIQEPYQLSDEQNLEIREVREQIKKGDLLSNTEANYEIDQWLGE
ncbi:hypothetical protein G3567_09635 [Psychroflexus sp. YR1-1]|uniref:Uncharacterized protein n=1 Tax=Psychroflexus aurantiacus TaxID=2709310 RepID=A0A6B3R1D3_9FLAO|nr:hypothetical protein [Psychroflexus aurantiacus]NEV94403.1 hypothetical protein [Psychroflexus aurantiacus]